jgi:NTE family protein
VPSGERALVLGGGGASGNAWLIGVVAGLCDAGLDVTHADLIIGTSAGSTAAAQITSLPPPHLLADILSAAPQPPASRQPAVRLLQRTDSVIRAAADAADMRRRMGAAFLQMPGTSDRSRQAQWRATVAARLPSHRWPQRPLLIPAVDAHIGEPVVFDRHSGVDLVDAVAASCAGGFAYAIGDHKYIDGGYRADVNADLAAGYARVLIIPPLGERTRKRPEWKLNLAAQVAELRASGSRVETILPDRDSQDALGVGMSLLDLSTRQPSARAGYNQGKALANQLTEFWR